MADFHTNVSAGLEEIATLSQQDSKVIVRGTDAGASHRGVQTTIPCLLSFAQERTWFLEQMKPYGSSNVILAASVMKGELDLDILGQSLNGIISRHEILRTAFRAHDGRPLLAVAPAMTLPLPTTDLRSIPTSLREAESRRLAAIEALTPFDLERAPLMRATLFRLEEQEYLLALCFHQLVSDERSVTILIKELAALYQSNLDGRLRSPTELPIQYADYAAWQRERQSAGGYEVQLSYWRQKLSGKLPPLELPLDHPRPLEQTHKAARAVLELDAALSDALIDLSRSNGVELSTTLLAAFAVQLLRTTSQKSLLIGMQIDGRDHDDARELIGPFGKHLPLLLNLSDNPSFLGLLPHVQAVVLGADTHKALPIEKLVEELQPDPDLGRHPIFQAAFALEETTPELGNLQGGIISSTKIERPTINFDLSIHWIKEDRKLSAFLRFNADLFDADTQQRMAGHQEVLLRSIVADPAQRLGELSLLTGGEVRQILNQWNQTQAEFPESYCLHELFEAQAEQFPDQIAVIADEQQVSYGELNGRANQLAHWLRRLGVGPDVVVGICIERGVEMVIGLLGILKAGGGYLPLDPTYPLERLAFLLEDAQAKVLIAQRRLEGRLLHVGEIVSIDGQWESIERMSTENLKGVVEPEHLAYVIYTSGSTGLPKGVMLNHRGRVNNFYDLDRRFEVSSSDRLLALASLSFDMSAYDTFGMLTAGATLVIPSPAEVLDPTIWLELILCHQVTLWHSVPAMLEMLIDHVADRQELTPNSLRLVSLGGDWIPVGLPGRVKSISEKIEVISIGGATEASMDSVIYPIEATDPAWKSIPYGKPLSNQLTYVMDVHQQLLPVGVPGELHLGGVGIAWGYFNRPQLTAERFIPNPFSDQPGDRLYKTGDLACYRADGNLELLGRMDFQIKIRGFRVELGEITAALRQHPSVQEAIVTAREDGSGSKRLVAYVIPQEKDDFLPQHNVGLANQASSDGPARYESTNGTNLKKELRLHLKGKLPEYMIPSAFVFLDVLPLTQNGKVDRQSLPAPRMERSESDPSYSAPRTPIEEVLAGIWSQLLRVKQVSVNDDFFELGGHSLLAMQLISRVRGIFHVELPLRTIFSTSILAELAEHIATAQHTERPSDMPALVSVPHSSRVLASYAQQRLWMVDKLAPGNVAYNIPVAMRLTGFLDLSALEQSFNETVRRHEILRTSFALDEAESVQVIAPTLDLKIPVVELSEATTQTEADVEQLILAEAERPFDLSVAPLFRVKLLRLAVDEHVLLLVMHHIISDGWSMGVLMHELTQLYAAFATRSPATLAPLPVQYADFALWQRQWFQGEALKGQLEYWKLQLAGARGVLELITDRPRPAVQTYKGATILFSLPKSLSEKSSELRQREGVTLYMLLLATLHTLLYRYSGQEDILVGTPTANRSHSALEGLTGFFVNMLVMRSKPSAKLSFLQFLSEVREVALDGYMHQDVPFETLVDEIQQQRDLSRHPLFQVVFGLQNAPAVKLELTGMTVKTLEVEERTAKFDLTLLMEERAEGLAGTLSHNTDLFDRSTAARMLKHFQCMLESIVENPHQLLADLPLLTNVERHQLLFEWNDCATGYDRFHCVHELFEAVADSSPEAIALTFKDEHLTYGELNVRSNQMAHYLRRSGVGPEVIVGVLMERSIDLVISLLGILKAGGVYVPFEPTYPREWLDTIIPEAQVSLILTQESLASAFDGQQVRLICLDVDFGQIALESKDTAVTLMDVDNLAYVMYTSGSTGRPKGIGVTHRGILRLVNSTNYADFSANEVFFLLAPIAFDLSTFELWGPLLNGARLSLMPSQLSSLQAIGEELLRCGVTTLWLTARLFHLIVDEHLGDLRGIRQLLAGGDVLSVEHVKRVLRELPDCMMINGYGPTENTTFTTCNRMQGDLEFGNSVPIGRPLSNTDVYLLSAEMQPVPIGLIGELYTGGDGLARGYKEPRLTAEAFVPHPFSSEPGARLYRTGDLARYLPDGQIEFLGRKDYQVKIRGFRIEPAAVETILSQHPSVRDCAVVVRESARGDKKLVAYVVAEPSAQQGSQEVRSYLQERLPEYMLPTVFVQLEAFPMTPNGKLDRRALPAPEWEGVGDGETLGPRTLTEELLQEIWAEVLNLEPPQIGMQKNFFELGGHSLSAMQVISRIKRVFGVELTMLELFQRPTIAGLSEPIDRELVRDDQE